MTSTEELFNPATLRVRFVGNPVTDKAVALKVIRTTDEEAAFFACSQCQRSHRDKVGAEACCVPPVCRVCEAEVPSYSIYCARHSRGKRLLKASVVEQSSCDWVYDESGGGHQDGFFDSMESLEDWYADEEADRPLYVYACKERRWEGVSVDDVLLSELEDHHEDADSHLIDVQELRDYLTAWNAKQKIASYDIDYSRVIPLDQGRFEIHLAELRNEVAGKEAA